MTLYALSLRFCDMEGCDNFASNNDKIADKLYGKMTDMVSHNGKHYCVECMGDKFEGSI